MDKIKIGLFGAGGISSRVAQGITESEVCRLAAVAARDIGRARSLAAKFGVEEYYGDYQQLLESDIEGVYIVTVNSMHFQHIKLCLEHGKHVICEKPMLVDQKDIDYLYELADKNNLLLLEAMKCRYLPTVAKIKSMLADLPYPRELLATFCRDEPFSKQYDHSYYDPHFGGALKVIGCYVLSWALELFSEPLVEENLQQLFHHGVDNSCWLYLKNNKGLFMQLGCSVDYDRDNQALITGQGYQIKIRDFWKALDIELWLDGKLSETFKTDIGSEFRYQVDYFGQAIKNADWQQENRRQRDFLKQIAGYYPTSS